MNKFAVAFAAATLMSLAACGEKPAAESNNATNEVVVNELDNAANAADNAANAMNNVANATNNASNAAE
jgi:predicted small lipoprotein YifL